MSRTAEELLSALDDLMSDGQSVKYQLKVLRSVYEWALAQTGINYGEGDRVVLAESFGAIPRSSGWWPYRECLVPGATARVKRIGFNEHHGYWYADIVLDAEWDHVEFNDARHWHGPAATTPDGFVPPQKYEQEQYPDGRKHTFALDVSDLTAAAPETLTPEPAAPPVAAVRADQQGGYDPQTTINGLRAEVSRAVQAIPSEFLANDPWENGVQRMADEIERLRAAAPSGADLQEPDGDLRRQIEALRDEAYSDRGTGGDKHRNWRGGQADAFDQVLALMAAAPSTPGAPE